MDNIPKTITTRKQARDGGYGFFWGTPCRKGHDGLRYVGGHCFHCVTEKMKTPERYAYKKKYRAENKEKIRAYNVNYYHSDRENQIKRSVEYMKKHPEVARRQRVKHANKIKAALAEWRKNNKDKCLHHSQTRRSRKTNNGGSHTLNEKKQLLISQNYRCINCGDDIRDRSSRHLDHIMPLHLGGGDSITNLQWLCKSCNLRKHSKHPIDFALENGRLC